MIFLPSRSPKTHVHSRLRVVSWELASKYHPKREEILSKHHHGNINWSTKDQEIFITWFLSPEERGHWVWLLCMHYKLTIIVTCSSFVFNFKLLKTVDHGVTDRDKFLKICYLKKKRARWLHKVCYLNGASSVL
jgi:hypothetical protein